MMPLCGTYRLLFIHVLYSNSLPTQTFKASVRYGIGQYKVVPLVLLNFFGHPKFRMCT